MTTETKLSGAPDDQKTGAFNENQDLKEGTNQNGDNDITPEELELLDDAGTSEPADDDELLDDSMLDETDDDGDKLNESNDLTGEDLDIPGSEADDWEESTGEEDEENNSYSVSDQDDDSDGIL